MTLRNSSTTAIILYLLHVLLQPKKHKSEGRNEVAVFSVMQARFVDLASISPARLDPRQTRPRAWLPNNNSGTWLRLTLLRLRTVRPTLRITRGRAGDGIIVEVHYPGWAKVRTARNLCNGIHDNQAGQVFYFSRQLHTRYAAPERGGNEKKTTPASHMQPSHYYHPSRSSQNFEKPQGANRGRQQRRACDGGGQSLGGALGWR